MKNWLFTRFRTASALVAVGIIAAMLPVAAADNDSASPDGAGSKTKPAATSNATVSNDDLAQMKAQLAAQQKQIEQLRQALEQQQKLLNGIAPVPADDKNGGISRPNLPKLGEVASTAPMIPPGPAPAPVANPLPPQTPENAAPSPLQLKIGDSYLTPVGFVDLTYVGRSTNIGSGIGTNFSATPYNNVPQGRIAENTISMQNSRIGARFDSIFHNTRLLAYWESDFLGAAPANQEVSTNSDTFRLRLIWLDARIGKWEFLGGQSWSLMTPGRNGISPLPSDLLYTQNMDTNYQIGLTWARDPGFRIVWHPTDTVAWALAFENPQQYIGGSSGAPVVTLPSNLVGPYTNLFNNGNTTTSTPNVAPDIITKLAFDPKVGDKHVHLEIGGENHVFRVYDSLNTQRYTSDGASVFLNTNLELFKGFHLIENFFYGNGGGRWLFGTIPDLIVNGNGSIAQIRAGSTLDGFEWQTNPKLILFGYYGGAYGQRAIAIDSTNAKQVGYGFTGSANSNNRTIQEGTLGANWTLWKDPKYGALQMIFQYSYLWREPWYVAANSPRQAHSNMLWVDLCYLLPGQPPNLH